MASVCVRTYVLVLIHFGLPTIAYLIHLMCLHLILETCSLYAQPPGHLVMPASLRPQLSRLIFCPSKEWDDRWDREWAPELTVTSGVIVSQSHWIQTRVGLKAWLSFEVNGKTEISKAYYNFSSIIITLFELFIRFCGNLSFYISS
jgi:hypothetical protein